MTKKIKFGLCGFIAVMLVACSSVPVDVASKTLLIPKKLELEIKDNTPGTPIPVGKINIQFVELSGFENRTVEEKINKQIRQKVGMNEAYSGNEDVTVTVQESQLTPQWVYLRAQAYIYPHGAANGQMHTYSQYFDLNTGDIIPLSALFKGDYQTVLNQAVRQWLATQDYDSEFQSISAEQCYFVKNTVLHLCFDEYSIAPGSAGLIDIPIEKALIQDVVKPNAILQP